MDFGHRLFSKLNSEKNKAAVERFFIYLAFLLFLLHLLIIFIADQTEFYPWLFEDLNTNYLPALYTPFSIILVYEVYFMIMALPLSFTESIRKQFEIISLIVIRKVFKDISDFDSFSAIWQQMDQFLDVVFDLTGGLVLFFLVAIFFQASKNRKRFEKSIQTEKFIKFKEVISLGLCILLFTLAFFAFYEWGREVYLSAYTDYVYSLELDTLFFDDLFTVMIFTDVLIFIASFLYTNRYEVMFRNAGFIASTILVRISLSVDNEYGVLVAVGAVVVGILSQLIYRYFSWLEVDESQRIYPRQTGS